ncbi:POK25 protein, partial [Ciccaba nigrolineata]|nr:POK25 protein [Ciccaba nigrolineata]
KLIAIDIKDCFFSIPLCEEDKERFASTVPSINREEPVKRWQWTVLPQGMKNSSVICQNYVAESLVPLQEGTTPRRIIHYMDDILLAAPSAEEVERLFQEAV